MSDSTPAFLSCRNSSVTDIHQAFHAENQRMAGTPDYFQNEMPRSLQIFRAN